MGLPDARRMRLAPTAAHLQGEYQHDNVFFLDWPAPIARVRLGERHVIASLQRVIVVFELAPHTDLNIMWLDTVDILAKCVCVCTALIVINSNN